MMLILKCYKKKGGQINSINVLLMLFTNKKLIMLILRFCVKCLKTVNKRLEMYYNLIIKVSMVLLYHLYHLINT